MHTQDQGNNETVSRGVFELHGRCTALTFSESKTFKTRKGAVAWLRRRGYDKNGVAFTARGPSEKAVVAALEAKIAGTA